MRVVSQVVRLVHALSHDEALGVSELARTLETDKSSVHRILRTMLAEQWVEQSPLTKKYSLGPVLTELSERSSRRGELLEAAEPVLDGLVSRLDETVMLSVRRGLRNVVELVRESTQEARVASQPGRRVPLYCGAAGKVLLAFDTGTVAERVVAEGLTGYTENTIVGSERLCEELRLTRTRGWGYENEEFSHGVTGIGAPVWDSNGCLIAAIALRAPSPRMSDVRAAVLAPPVLEAADAISRRMEHAAARRRSL